MLHLRLCSETIATKTGKHKVPQSKKKKMNINVTNYFEPNFDV